MITKTKDFFLLLKQNSAISQDRLTLYMNYLAVMYAFYLPIASQPRATIFSLIILLFLFRRNYIFYIKKSLFNPIVQALLLYILMHFIWLFGSENEQHASQMLKLSEYAIIPFIFLTFLTKEFAQKAITAFITSLLLSEILSYLIRFQVVPEKLEFLKSTLYQAVSQLDPSPFLLHMHYAVTLSIVVAFLFFRLLHKKNSFKVKFIYTFFLLSATLNLSLIGGRSGYITFVILLLSVVLLEYRKKAFVPLVGIFLFISLVATLAYNFSPMFKERIDYSKESIHTIYNNPKDLNTSMGQRIGLWRYSSDVIKDNFIFGVGTGDQMDAIHNLMTQEDDMLKYFHHQHSMYIEVFTQFGVLGILVFLNIFYQIFKYKEISDENRKLLYITTLAIMIALLTETFSTRYYLPLLAIIISATISKNKFLHQENYKNRENILLPYLIIAALITLTSVL